MGEADANDALQLLHVSPKLAIGFDDLFNMLLHSGDLSRLGADLGAGLHGRSQVLLVANFGKEDTSSINKHESQKPVLIIIKDPPNGDLVTINPPKGVCYSFLKGGCTGTHNGKPCNRGSHEWPDSLAKYKPKA